MSPMSIDVIKRQIRKISYICTNERHDDLTERTLHFRWEIISQEIKLSSTLRTTSLGKQGILKCYIHCFLLVRCER